MSLHTDLHGNNITYSTLIEAAKRRTVEADPSRSDVYYDSDILREFCGCLINAESNIEVSFAHYTVREYLDSQRFSGKLVSLFPSPVLRPVSGDGLRRQLITAVLMEAQCTDEEYESLENHYIEDWMARRLLYHSRKPQIRNHHIHIRCVTPRYLELPRGNGGSDQ